MADPWVVLFNRDLPVLQERLGRIAKALETLVELKQIELEYQKMQAGIHSMGHGD
jgi:hypothetical protein